MKFLEKIPHFRPQRNKKFFMPSIENHVPVTPAKGEPINTFKLIVT